MQLHGGELHGNRDPAGRIALGPPGRGKDPPCLCELTGLAERAGVQVQGHGVTGAGRARQGRDRVTGAVAGQPDDAEVAPGARAGQDLGRAFERGLRGGEVAGVDLGRADQGEGIGQRGATALRVGPAGQRTLELGHGAGGGAAAVQGHAQDLARLGQRGVAGAGGRLRDRGDELRRGFVRASGREQGLGARDRPGQVAGRVATRRADLVEQRQRRGGVAGLALEVGQAQGHVAQAGVETARGAQRRAGAGQVAAGQAGLAQEGVGRGAARVPVEIALGVRLGLGGLAHGQLAVTAHDVDVGIAAGQIVEIGQEGQGLAAVDGRGGPGQAQAGGEVARLGPEHGAEQLAGLLAVARAQIGVGQAEAVGRVLAAQALGPGAEVALDGGDRPARLAGLGVVVAEQDVGVVAGREAGHHLLEQGHAFVRLSGQEQLRAQGGQHVGIVRGQVLGPAQERDAGRILRERGVHAGAQHVDVDAARIERQGAVEAAAGLGIVAPGHARARVLDQERAVVLVDAALGRRLGHGPGRPQRAQRHRNQDRDQGQGRGPGPGPGYPGCGRPGPGPGCPGQDQAHARRCAIRTHGRDAHRTLSLRLKSRAGRRCHGRSLRTAGPLRGRRAGCAPRW